MDKLGIIITGTGTSVGKTVSTSLLLRALLKKNIEAKAVKIIQTGTELGESDAAIYEQTVQDLAKSSKAHSQVLHSLKFPSSPHLALAKENLKLKASR
ncbi:MAG: AAA family ATPase, partial [Desulfovibrionaceae bacterium]|nr:AAA family ATPase [Desulfovibrionaceae bacterium]